MPKIRIAGAGISGLAAAINLAKEGIKTEVFELNKDCGCRFHGDLQGIENWSYNREALAHIESMGIKTDFYHKPVNSVVITNPHESITIKTSSPSFYLVRRGSGDRTLDQSLKEQALSCGARINFSRKLPENEADITATGPLGREVFGVDSGIVFQSDMPDTFEMLLGDQFAYRGYSYLLVLDGYACLCTVLFDDFKSVNGCMRKTKEFFVKKYNLKINSPKTVGGVGHFSVKPTFASGKSLLVGEAAGIQDMLFGFGIRSSIHSGYLAAQSIIDSGDCIKDYEKSAKAAFSGKIKASFVNRFFWNRMGGDYRPVMKILKKSKNHLKLLKTAYNYNTLHRTCYPLAYAFNR